MVWLNPATWHKTKTQRQRHRNHNITVRVEGAFIWTTSRGLSGEKQQAASHPERRRNACTHQFVNSSTEVGRLHLSLSKYCWYLNQALDFQRHSSLLRQEHIAEGWQLISLMDHYVVQPLLQLWSPCQLTPLCTSSLSLSNTLLLKLKAGCTELICSMRGGTDWFYFTFSLKVIYEVFNHKWQGGVMFGWVGPCIVWMLRAAITCTTYITADCRVQ